MYTSERQARDLSELGRREIEKLVTQLEAEMRSAAKELEFERAAALRDEVQQIRLRVLEEDEATKVARAAERAAASVSRAGTTDAIGPAQRGRSRRRGRAGRAEAPAENGGIEVTSITVLPAGESPVGAVAGDPSAGDDGGALAAEWLPGIRDEHGDDGGWLQRWSDRQTWDRTVTPNVIRRTGQRPVRRTRRRG
jgi:hypothetical protein